jgi:hypothetical protein
VADYKQANATLAMQLAQRATSALLVTLPAPSVDVAPRQRVEWRQFEASLIAVSLPMAVYFAPASHATAQLSQLAAAADASTRLATTLDWRAANQRELQPIDVTNLHVSLLLLLLF